LDLQFHVVNVELRHLRSFLVLAQELNFTRAAARLNIVQQALSAQMRQLEEELGAALFVRTTRRVELTPAGHALLDHAPAALRTVESAFDRVRDSVAGESGSLTLGLLATASLDFTPRVLRDFAEDKPKVNVSIRNVAFDDPSGGVRSRQADVAIVWRPFDEDGLACEPLFTDHRVAVLPIDHPLAAVKTVDAATLAAEPFVWVDDMDEIARGFWTLSDVRRGRPPRVGATITGFEDLFAAVRAGRAVAACPGSIASTLPWRDLVTRPVRGLAPAVVAACWRADDRSPFVKAFVACARRAAGVDADTTPAASPTRTNTSRKAQQN
jgi:DNA-binding transcriptional LysR family regulator